MDNQTIPRMRHLWKDAREKYQSFFACLEEVRREIGNDALSDWCIDNLRVGLDIIAKYRIFLRDNDAQRVKRELAEAKKAADDKKKAERLAAEQARVAEKQRLAEEHKKAVQAKIEADRAKDRHKRTQKRTKGKQGKPHERGPQANISRRVRENRGDLDGLLDQWQKLAVREEKNREDWIVIFIGKAKLLCAMRDANPSNEAFGEWLEHNNRCQIKLSHQNRAGYINLGRLEEPLLREVLEATNSRSPELIWAEYRPRPNLKVVS